MKVQFITPALILFGFLFSLPLIWAEAEERSIDSGSGLSSPFFEAGKVPDGWKLWSRVGARRGAIAEWIVDNGERLP